MQGVTLIIAVIGSMAVLVLQPAYALAAYVATLVWFPDFLRVNIGTIELSVGRIIVTVLLLRCLLNDELRRKFVWSRLDTWVSLTIAAIAGVYCVACGFSYAAVENRGGLITDTWFVYLAARFIITDKDALMRFIKTTAIILVPLAAHGVVEATTGWQPFHQLSQFRRWRPNEIEHGDVLATQARWGLTRAIGPFSHPILFGECFAMFLPMVWALRHERDNWASLAKWLSAMAVLGAISSMSSGPWGMLVVVILCLVLEKYKRWLKTVLVGFVVLCVLAEVGSNRPLYHVVLEGLNLGKGDWWSRARLIDAAIDNFDEWWLAGYGGIDPGWGSREGGYFWGNFTDANNQFILIGMEAGFFAVIALCGVFVVAFRGLARAFKETTDKALRSVYWSLGTVLVGVIAAWQGVSFFGQMNALFYCILGIIGSSFAFAKQTAAETTAALHGWQR